MDRGLIALLPAVRDLAGPDQVILAAGGIADGRGLAAALMLGAMAGHGAEAKMYGAFSVRCLSMAGAT